MSDQGANIYSDASTYSNNTCRKIICSVPETCMEYTVITYTSLSESEITAALSDKLARSCYSFDIYYNQEQSKNNFA